MRTLHNNPLTRASVRRLVVFACLLCCVWLPVSQARADHHNIAVISIVGDRFTSASIGNTIFTRKSHTTGVKPWRIDRFVETTIKDTLRQNKSIRIKDVRIKRGPLMKVYDTSGHGFLEEGDYDLTRIAPIMPFLKRKGADTLVLVIAADIPDPILEANMRFRAYGMYRSARLFTKHYLYAYLRVLVINTADGKLRQEEEIIDYQQIDKAHWARQLNELPFGSKHFVRDTIKRMMAVSVTAALAKAGMVKPAVVRKRKAAAERMTRRASETGGISVGSGGYSQAVKRVYLALDTQRVFERYARNHVRKQVRGDTTLYNDTIRDWVEEHFSWRELRRPLTLMYSRMRLSAEELNEIAEIAEERDGIAPPSREEMRSLRGVWQRLADDDALNNLQRAIKDRKRLITREAGRLRR